MNFEKFSVTAHNNLQNDASYNNDIKIALSH
jgi:hypothetical protein